MENSTLTFGCFVFTLEEVWQIIAANHWRVIKKNNMASRALVIPRTLWADLGKEMTALVWVFSGSVRTVASMR